MITEEDAPKTKEEKIKNYLEIITDRIPKIISMAEEDDFSTIIKNAKSLQKLVEKIGDKYKKTESMIKDMNEACNNMFFFMRKNKLSKKLNTAIAEAIISTFHINELFDLKAIYVQNCPNGTYEGEMKNGKREGKGKFFFLNGDLYEGEFKNNCKDKYGKYTYSNKDIYEGEFNKGEIHGKGKYIYVEGDIYEGEYKHENRDGKRRCRDECDPVCGGAFRKRQNVRL